MSKKNYKALLDFKTIEGLDNSIFKTMQKLHKIEEEKGINSLDYDKACEILQFYLDSEDEYVGKVVSEDPDFDVVSEEIDFDYSQTEEHLVALAKGEKIAKLYRLCRLFSNKVADETYSTSYFDITDTFFEEVDAVLLNNCADPSLKYKLALVNPVLCYDLASHYFDTEALYKEIFTDQARFVAEEDNKARTDFFKFIFDSVYSKYLSTNNEIYYHLLEAIHVLIPNEAEILASKRYEFASEKNKPLIARINAELSTKGTVKTIE